MISWDDLKYVLALARHQSAAAAGKALRVNATTVARRVAALETALNVPLFERTSSGAVPTSAGARAVASAERIEREVLDLDGRINGVDSDLHGELRLTSLDVVFDLWQRDFLAFGSAHPKLQLSLASSSEAADLIRREADVAIRFLVMPPDRLVGRRLLEVFFAVYVSDALVDSVGKRSTDTLPTYADYPWIGWDAPHTEATQRVISEWAPGAKVRLRINSMNRLIRCLEAGEGVSVLPCFIGDRSTHLRRLGPYFVGETYLWALTREPLRRTARVRALMDVIAEISRRDAGLFMGEKPSRSRVDVGS